MTTTCSWSGDLLFFVALVRLGICSISAGIPTRFLDIKAFDELSLCGIGRKCEDLGFHCIITVFENIAP